MVEAAGVEPEIREIDKFVMAHDFWCEFVGLAVVAAARGLHCRPHESSVFDLVFGEITEAAGHCSRRCSFWRRERCSAVPAARTTGFVPPPSPLAKPHG